MNMKMLENALTVVGGAAFLWGAISKVTGWTCWFAPGTYWRGAIGCLAIAITLLLRDMRDRSGMRA